MLRLARLGGPLLLLLTACSGDLLDQSCSGQAVAICNPYEYAVVTEASLTPEALTIADFTQDARVQVELDFCVNRPRVHSVFVTARVGEGANTDIFTLDEVEDPDGDGSIDATIPNPFGSRFPEDTEIVLVFTPRSGPNGPMGCDGEPFTTTYRTGSGFLP
jgi:hypothetical protein